MIAEKASERSEAFLLAARRSSDGLVEAFFGKETAENIGKTAFEGQSPVSGGGDGSIL